MSLTQPPPADDAETVRPPSRRFTILFTLAMVFIAMGYMWVWQVKTSRVIAEPPPDLVLASMDSRLPGHGPADDAALRDSLEARIRAIPRIRLFRSVADIPPADTTPGRLPPLAFALHGVLDSAPDGLLSLELRRTDASSDSLVYIYRVRGRTPSEVVHRMAVQIAMSFGLALPDTASAPRAQRDSGGTKTGTER